MAIPSKSGVRMAVEKMIERFRDVGFMVLSALFIKCRYGVFLDRIC